MRVFTLITILVTLVTPACLKAQVKLERRSFLDGKMELLVPVNFKPMTAAMMNFKYPNANQKPNIVLTDEYAEVNIVISFLSQSLKSSQIDEFKNFQISMLKKLRPDAKWLEDGTKVVNGKKIGYFKFVSNAIDQTVFNYYFFTDMDGKVLLMTFNCIEKLLPEWKDTSESIVASLTVK